MGGLVGRQLRQRRPDRPELDEPGLQGLLPGLGPVQGNAQPEDLLRQRPNPVRLIAQPSQRRAVLNVLVVLPAYGLLVPLRRLLLTSQPLPQTGELPVQPGYLLTQLTSFRAQRLDRGLLVLRLLQGARSRRLALSAGEVGLCLAGSMLASERSFSRRVTSACKESASFAVRRTSCVSSTAAFSLLRLLSSCHFREPVRARDSTSAQRSSSQRASAASARACSRSHSERQSRGAHAGAASGDDQIPSSLSTSVRPDPKSSSRTTMRSTIARGVPCYQPPCRHSSRRDS